MSDISKCTNQKCPMHLYCHRYTAPAHKRWQAYMEFKPEEGEVKCDAFWGNESYLKLNKKKKKKK